MSKVSKMQGVPAHLETLKSDGKAQKIYWCKFSEHIKNHKYKCLCNDSGYYEKECHSAKHCEYYQEETE